MNLHDFKASVENNQPPSDLPVSLQALWQQARGNWDAAHALAQSDNSPLASWVHAHLHRVEGDLGNAAYWYRRASKPQSTAGLAAEWDEIAEELMPGG